MKVYIAFSGAYEDRRTIGVFATREAAVEKCRQVEEPNWTHMWFNEKHNPWTPDAADVEEWEVAE